MSDLKVELKSKNENKIEDTQALQEKKFKDYFENQEQEYENDFIVEPIKDVIKKIEQKNHQPYEFDSTKQKFRNFGRLGIELEK